LGRRAGKTIEGKKSNVGTKKDGGVRAKREKKSNTQITRAEDKDHPKKGGEWKALCMNRNQHQEKLKKPKKRRKKEKGGSFC